MRVVPAATILGMVSVWSATFAEGERRECPVSNATASLTGDQSPSRTKWFGSESLAVAIPEDGIWRGMGADHDFFDKLFWVAGGFQPGLESDFELVGRHMQDDKIRPIVSEPTNALNEGFGGWAILVGVGFPKTGCWELTGSYQGQELTFVVEVVDD